jgi:hypothetical protein
VPYLLRLISDDSKGFLLLRRKWRRVKRGRGLKTPAGEAA